MLLLAVATDTQSRSRTGIKRREGSFKVLTKQKIRTVQKPSSRINTFFFLGLLQLYAILVDCLNWLQVTKHAEAGSRWRFPSVTFRRRPSSGATTLPNFPILCAPCHRLNLPRNIFRARKSSPKDVLFGCID